MGAAARTGEESNVAAQNKVMVTEQAVTPNDGLSARLKWLLGDTMNALHLSTTASPPWPAPHVTLRTLAHGLQHIVHSAQAPSLNKSRPPEGPAPRRSGFTASGKAMIAPAKHNRSAPKAPSKTEKHKSRPHLLIDQMSKNGPKSIWRGVKTSGR